jgi:hypothetical protein
MAPEIWIFSLFVSPTPKSLEGWHPVPVCVQLNFRINSPHHTPAKAPAKGFKRDVKGACQAEIPLRADEGESVLV